MAAGIIAPGSPAKTIAYSPAASSNSAAMSGTELTDLAKA